ncbi:MAG: polysaccharide deacetylase family protein, partial [Cyanobacteria bacterium P01_H01_bin.130]
MSCSSSNPPTPKSLAARRRQRARGRANFRLSFIIALGSLIGGLGAIAAHNALGNFSTVSPQASVPNSLPNGAPSAAPTAPIAPAAPTTAIAPQGSPAPIPAAPTTTADLPANPPQPAIASEPVALASFTPTATNTADLATNNTPSRSPLSELWETPIAQLQQQAEQLDITRLAKSGQIPQQFQGKVIYGGGLSNTDKVIALTFDDGPWPETTAAVMNLLKEHGGKGTFFVVGNLVQRYPDLVKRMVEEGHEVANHTWSHRLAYSPPTIAAQEIENATATIARHTGFSTRIYRPPGGILNNGLVNYARNKGYAILMWSTD